MSQQPLVDRVRAIGRLDRSPAHRQPPSEHVFIAALVSVACSLFTNAILVKIAITVLPSTRGFSHFRFFDYGGLTILGIAAAAGSWAVVTRITSQPRWFFLRLAVVVTLCLWAPDGWLLWRGESPKAVVVLMAMHLAIALITYNFLVRLAPVRPLPGDASRMASAQIHLAQLPSGSTPYGISADVAQSEGRPAGSALWLAMAGGVGLELALGLVALLVVPTGRPSGWIPAKGEAVYFAHAVLGAVLALGGLVALEQAIRSSKLARIGAVAGLAGLGLGLVGGVLATSHSARLGGMALMLLGAAVAGLGYLAPVIG
ncbi:MAG: DUF6069 family protein [Acidimicrobiales bacterium]